jgi:hypothetical protein
MCGIGPAFSERCHHNLLLMTIMCLRLMLQDGVVQQTVTGVQGPPLVQLISSMTDPAGKGATV